MTTNTKTDNYVKVEPNFSWGHAKDYTPLWVSTCYVLVSSYDVAGVILGPSCMSNTKKGHKTCPKGRLHPFS